MHELSYEVTRRDLKWMRWCLAGAEIFSTCSKAQYMAVVVDANGHVLGTGYNGGPAGVEHCTEGGCPRVVNNVPSGTPYDYGPGLCIAIHAEPNAIMHSDYTDRIGSTLYVNGPPCFGCAKLISNSGVRRLVYLEDRSRTDFAQSEQFMQTAGLIVVEMDRDYLLSETETINAA